MTASADTIGWITRVGLIGLYASALVAGDPGEFPAAAPFLFRTRRGMPNVYAKLVRGELVKVGDAGKGGRAHDPSN
jgi:hypothetical protein